MTSDEIKQTHPADFSANSWLREIALQLARLNERQSDMPKMPPPKPTQRRL